MKIKFANTVIEKIIIAINPRVNYPSEIAKKINVTYSHTCNEIEKLIEANLITKQNKERKCYLTLTEKGLKIQQILRELKKANEEI